MSDMENLQLFEDQAIRTAWNEEEEEWYFSVVDVVGALTEQPDIRRAAKYWSVLKVRIKAEGNELTTNCSQLKLKAADGKRRLTDGSGLVYYPEWKLYAPKNPLTLLEDGGNALV